MNESQNPAAAPPPRDPDPDVQIEALLQFEPVARQTRRHDGWSPARQHGFIAALARLGDVDRAAHSVGRTASGAWKVRTSAEAEGFSDAWDAALDLFHARNPGLSRRGGRASPRWGAPPPPRPEAPPEGWVDPAEHYLTPQEFVDGILKRYWLKLGQERQARLEGRIVEADFYVRQLTWLEVALDLGGNADDLLKSLKRGGQDVMRIVATPMSTLLEKLRRAYWQEKGEVDRPPSSPLGRQGEGAAIGEAPPWEYRRERDGDEKEWRRREDEKAALRAEAQQAWEEKARADAEAWSAREQGPGEAGVPEV